MKVKFTFEYTRIEEEEIFEFGEKTTDKEIDSVWWSWSNDIVESYSSTFGLDDCYDDEVEYNEIIKRNIQDNSWWDKI